MQDKFLKLSTLIKDLFAKIQIRLVIFIFKMTLGYDLGYDLSETCQSEIFKKDKHHKKADKILHLTFSPVPHRPVFKLL